MMRTVLAMLGSLSLASVAFAGDVGFIEDFALSRDRNTALRQLIPGTEDHYYYHSLYYQLTEQYEQAEALFDPWIKRHGETPRLNEIRTRQALLTYDRNPRKSLDYIKSRLHIEYNHQKVTPGAAPNLPTRLNPEGISRQVLLADSFRRWSDLGNFEPSAFEWLSLENLTPTRRRILLQKLITPDVPNLVPLIVEDLRTIDSPAFGNLAIHRRLTLAQLDQLQKAMPDLHNQPNFVSIYLSKLQPGADEDWRHNPAQLRAFLERQLTFARTLNGTHNSLKVHLLFQLLTLERSQNKFPKELFMEYLQLPRNVHYLSRRLTDAEDYRRFAANLSHDFTQVTLLPPVVDDEPLVRSYLSHFFKEENTYLPYEPFINNVYLSHLFAETKIVNGLGDTERLASSLPPELFQALKDRIDIDFAPYNPSHFAIDQPVQIDVHVKNVPTLIVKVFEINTVNFYRDQKREIDTDVNLDGLVPNIERSHAYTEPPLRRVARKFEFPEITKPGVYVVDFIGAGKSSRALIRKGRLRPLVATGSDGHRVSVVNEKNELVKDASIILGGKEYSPDANGVVTVPFSTSPGRQSIVIRRGEFASLDSLDHQPENYQLVAGIYAEREALLSQRLADLIIRPSLRLNGSPISIKTLEQPRLRLVATDLDGIVTTSEIPDVRLFEDRETTHEFRVPPRLASLSITLTAKVTSLITNQPVEVVSTDTFTLNGIQKSDKIEDLHLTRLGEDYVLEMRGRTGEPKTDRPVQVRFKHRDFIEEVFFAMKTDAAGRIFLGRLNDIMSVSVVGPESTAHTWSLPTDEVTSRSVVHARVGEVIGIPYPTKAKAPSREEFSLLEVVGEMSRRMMTMTVQRGRQMYTVVQPTGEVRTDRFDAIRVTNGQIELHGLQPGDYDLTLKQINKINQKIRIRVTDGPVAAGFALGASRHLELPRLKPVRISDLTSDADSITVQLADVSPFARVHLFASRYVPEYSVFDHLARVQDSTLHGVYPGHADSVYLTGRNIGDEYRYVLDRKYQKKYPGNMLDRPQLILNPWAVRSTVTGEQLAQAGEEFGMKGAATPPAAAAAPVNPEMKAKRAALEQAAQLSADLDFLKETSTVLLNLVPDDKGIVKIDRKQLGSHTQLYVVAVDPLHTMVRTLNLPEQPTSFLDLRLRAGLDPKGHFNQQKTVSVLSENKPFVLEDAVNSRFESYDSLSKVYGLYTTLLTNDAQLPEFNFLTSWHRLKPEEKREKYSKYACHELNFFIYKKDPEFFNTVIKPYIANKKDKTFVDRWLLGEDVQEYVKPWQFQRLNTFERILLAQRVAGEGPKTARQIADLLKLLPPNRELERILFETGVKGSGLEEGNMFGRKQVELQRQRALGLNGAMPSLNAPALPGGGFGGGGFGGGVGGALGGMPPPGPAGAPGSGPAGPTGMAAAKPAMSRAAGARRDAAKEMKKLSDEKEKSESLAESLEADKAGKGEGKDLFFYEDRAAKRQEYRQLYRKIESTQEWAENNYYKLLIQEHTSQLIEPNPFWQDYANHKEGPFLSQHVAKAARNFHEAILALAVLELPFEAKKNVAQFDGGKMTLTPAQKLIAFHEEVRPVAAPNGKLPILVSQNFYKNGDRYREENGERLDKFVKEFVVHTVYGCQVVVTNPGPSPQRLNLLLQVPVGSIPLNAMQSTKTVLLDLQPYQTQAIDYLFYFPAAGKFDHFPVHVSKNEVPVAAAQPVPFEVLEKPTQLDTESWDYVSQNGTNEQVIEFLKRENVFALNLDMIAWRMKDPAFFEQVTTLLADRHSYSPTLWSYALQHNNLPAAQQFLLHQDQLANEVGGPIATTLVNYEPVARFTYEHLEYKPLVNARAHALGKRRQIVNDRLHTQYHAFLKQLSYHKQLTDDDELAAVYYLMQQDRIEEAEKFFAEVDPARVATKLQYDYCAAYLAMYSDDPQRARTVANKYANYPVDRWKNLFSNLTVTLDEIEGKAARVVDAKDRDQQQAQLAATEPSFEVAVDARALNLNWQNLKSVTVNYYLMDVELLFSTNPFVQQGAGKQFSLIKPNSTQVVNLPEGQSKFSVTLPAELQKKNVLIEVTGAGKTRTVPYYANAMDVKLTENYGQLKVTNATTGKPLSKVYVKTYVRSADGQVKFYKDGYTDLRGRFDYATVSTPERSPAMRFSILVLSEEFGATIRESAPPQQ